MARQQQHHHEQLATIPHKLPKAQRQQSRSPARSRPPKDSKRRRSPTDKSKRGSSIKSNPAYGSSYSWDAALGQAFIDRISSIRAPPQSEAAMVEAEAIPRKDNPYMALVQLFNQFQGMPIDNKKVLVTVNVLGSTGPLRVLVTADATIKDLIKITLLKYAHEGRVPALGRKSRYFQLYSSQFSSQALKHEDKVADSGTRNFVLCPEVNATSCGSSSTSPGRPTKSASWWSYVTGIKSFV